VIHIFAVTLLDKARFCEFPPGVIPLSPLFDVLGGGVVATVHLPDLGRRPMRRRVSFLRFQGKHSIKGPRMTIPHPFDLYDVARFFSKVDVKNEFECWPFEGHKQYQGYGQFAAIGQSFYAHRFSYVLFNGPIEPDIVVRHKCDNPSCVNPYHLETGTHQDNMRDRNIRGRTARGTRNPRSKLTEEQVLEIYKDPRTFVEIGKAYGVGPEAVSRIKNGRNWGHVTGAKPPVRIN
jgi:hypothetical protein